MGRSARQGRIAQQQRDHQEDAAPLVDSALVIDVAGIIRFGDERASRVLFRPLDVSDADLTALSGTGLSALHVPVIYQGRDAFPGTFEIIAEWNAAIAARPDRLRRITVHSDLQRAKEQNCLGIILGVHESNHFRCVEDVDLFHRHGQRISLLTNSQQNLIGSGFTDRSAGGLSNFGYCVVERMNHVGMTLDISHSNERTKLDVLEATTKPVLISHGNCRALNANPRTETDDMLRRLAKCGGVIGISAIRMFVTSEEPTTIDDFLNHIDHVASLVGVEHVGLGIDVPVQGWDSLPPENQFKLPAYMRNEGTQRGLDIEGLAQTDRIYAISAGLLRRGYSDQDVSAVLGGNFSRVFKESWAPFQ